MANEKRLIEQVEDILSKWEFFYGQRAGRELWAEKPREVQEKDIADFCRDISVVRSAIVNAVEVVHGRWLDWHGNPTQPNMFYRWWKCSECGHQYAFDEAVKRNYFASSYCPNCGAKMDGDA